MIVSQTSADATVAGIRSNHDSQAAVEPGTVVIHILSPADIPREASIGCLNEDEITHAGRFRFETDADRWMACRARLRTILGEAIQRPPVEVPLVFSKYGKPSLAPPFDALHFNLSHCPELAVIALSCDGPVGIDLEALGRARDLLECETNFCHPGEILDLPVEQSARACQLLRIWTAKEAVLKAMGDGLSHPPESVRINFQQSGSRAVSDAPLAGIEKHTLHELCHTMLCGYQAFVSIPASVEAIRII